ncbi:DUF4012 domain-containing protein [Patescibacteria group bacterium]|nr:DUF4012 domain-containing protein [Patescibacteria group bacterium]
MKKSSVKINPLKGKFFDIKPPGKTSAPVSRKWKNFRYFAVIAFLIFIGLNLSNIYMQGRDLAATSKDSAMAGYDYLQSGIESLKDKDYKKAGSWFERAEIKFSELAEGTEHLTSQANELMEGSLYLDTAGKLIDSGITISQIGQSIAVLIEEAALIPQTFISNQLDEEQVDLTLLVYSAKEKLDEIYAGALNLQQNITTLNSDLLPSDLQGQITKGQEQIAQVIALMREFNLNFETILMLLGDETPHSYLVLFQNNHELRATGGFIGSYMMIDVNDGVITKMEAKDVYETDGQLTEVVPAPPGIDKIAEHLYMRDSNYSPDFPTSAEQVMWFLEHSNQPSVDTVIAIDQSVVEQLLEITGPIYLEHFPFQIRSDNFNDLISYYIEAKISESSTPKQMLFDFIPVFKERILTLDSFDEAINVIKDMVNARHIQVYSKDPDVQALAQRLQVDGSIVEPAEKTDFLSIISTAIGGNKSDGYIEMNIGHNTNIDALGTIIDDLSITKTHTWDDAQFSKWQGIINRYGTGETSLDTLNFIMGGGENIDYMRVYVPKGSNLLNTEGISIEDIEISEDLAYTIFAFTFGPLSADSNQTINLQYQLPYSLNFETTDIYDLNIQKQAGTEDQTLLKTLTISEDLFVSESYPSSTKPFTLNPIIEMNFDENFTFNSTIEKVNK